MTIRHTLAAAALTIALATPAMAQQKPPAKPEASKTDHSKMDHGKMDHAAMHAEHMKQGAKPAWKELDAYHGLMMATWHPAKDKNDMAPTRGMITQMVASAKAVSESKAPAACQKPELAKAQTGLVAETEKVQKLVDAKADDAALKAAMKGLHDAFEVLEQGCNTGMKH